MIHHGIWSNHKGERVAFINQTAAQRMIHQAKEGDEVVVSSVTGERFGDKKILAELVKHTVHGRWHWTYWRVK